MRRALTIALLLAMVGCSSRSRQAQAIVESGKARFTVIAPECIRIEYSENGEFVDARSMFAVNRGAAFLEYTLERESNLVTIDTGKIRLTHTADGTPFGPHNLTALIRNGGGDATWVPGMVTRANLGGARRAIGGISGPVDLGEGLLARDGWYLLDDSRRPLLTDDWVAGRPASAGIDWYLFGYGSDYKAALRAMTAVGGAVPMPRKYALGAWYSRYWPHTSKDYRRIVEEYRQHDFPLDVVVMDTDWHRGGWTGWSWNRNLLPDPEALLKWLHEQRLTVALNAHPAGGVQPGEDMYAAFMKEMGEDPATGRTLPFDAVNRQYLDTFFKHTHLPLNRAGVDFWWLDWQQRLYTASVPGLTNLAWLNRYYYQHSERAGLRGLSLSRWAGWGDHRNVIHFSGDADTRWPLLEFEVPFTATSGNVGCFFWSHDIGGHKGPHNEET
ncbi:MAG: alpha-xylosidase, partial [Acidobacteria bacterium]|nr:alpha-xylosidase [Acidobacteriota bacterium]